jgi:uncharacterized membrane protein YsdA (DUF1294 family)
MEDIMASTLLILVFWLVVLGVVAFWIAQFNQLMALPDERFPGRHDTVVWAVVLIVLPVLGALTLWFYHSDKNTGAPKR